MLILASSSPYRQQLLSRLRMSFKCLPPNIDESPQIDESCQELAARLALQKAQAVSRQLSTDSEIAVDGETLIIGSDQVASFGDKLLGKPGNHANAVEQLLNCRSRWVSFYTSLVLLHPASEEYKTSTVETKVSFRDLNKHQIEHYLKTEQPYDCAGSFKVEGLGITLFKKIETNDPTALIGLPLIALTSMLAHFGHHPLQGDSSGTQSSN